MKRLTAFFRPMACLAVFLTCYPLVLLANALSGLPLERMWFCLAQQAVVCLCGMIGLCYGWLFRGLPSKLTFLTRILLFFLSLGTGFGVFFLMWNNGHGVGILASATLSFLCCGAFFLGALFYELPYSRIYPLKLYIAGIVVNFLALFFSWILDLPVAQSVQVAVFLIVTAIFALLCNQSNIDFLMERRRHAMENLPKKIRRYNLRLLTTFMVVLLAVYLCRGWIAKGLLAVWRVARIGIVWLMRFFAWLTSLLYQEGVQTEESPMPQQDMGLGAAESKPDYFTPILTVLLLFGLVYLLFRNRKKIWAALLQGIMAIRQGLHAFFTERRKGFIPVESGGEFIDDEELLSREINPENFRRQRSRSRQRQWRKEYRGYCKLPDSTEKYRMGWKLFTQALVLQGAELLPSDTPAEVWEKTGSIRALPVDSHLDEILAGERVLQGYCDLRYGELSVSQEEQQLMNRLLERMREKVLGSRTTGRKKQQ